MNDAFEEIRVKKALHYHGRYIPCNFDLNIYRGCGHGCKYCFAQYSHSYLDSRDFFGHIFVKTNIVEALDRELSSKKWLGDPINIGGVTDSYQPAEQGYRLMPEVLRVLIKHKNPIILTTKSSLIMRDFDAIKELASVARVHIGASIITTDETLRKTLEPGASPVAQRLEMLGEFKKAGCSTGILLMPIIPELTDSQENIESVFSEAKKRDIDGVSAWTLNLRGRTRWGFMDFIRKNFPHLDKRFRDLYGPQGYVSREYCGKIMKIVSSLHGKYRLPGVRIENIERRIPEQQLRLF